MVAGIIENPMKMLDLMKIKIYQEKRNLSERECYGNIKFK